MPAALAGITAELLGVTMPLSDENDSLSVLSLDPFHGGSHRQFTECLANTSQHHWHVITGKPVHWKWRMRSAPIDFVHRTRELIAALGYPNVLFCTDMLDLPVYLGLLGDSRIQQIPKVLYFHENQWTYPVSPNRKVDNHFGYTNLLSAMTADEVWFNSQFHLDDFIKGSSNFLKQMPDTRDLHSLDALEAKARIIPPGFTPPPEVPLIATIPDTLPTNAPGQTHRLPGTKLQTGEQDAEEMPRAKVAPQITVGWVSRWEYDKCPEEFVTFLRMLTDANLNFKLILLGARPRHPVPQLKEINETYKAQIIHDGFAKDLKDYWRLLGQMDVVVSTANHEFFGIAICEAIWAGAIPIVPDKLSYREHIPKSCRYKTLDDAISLVANYTSTAARRQQSSLCRKHIEPLQTSGIIKQIDAHLRDLSAH